MSGVNTMWHGWGGQLQEGGTLLATQHRSKWTQKLPCSRIVITPSEVGACHCAAKKAACNLQRKGEVP